MEASDTNKALDPKALLEHLFSDPKDLLSSEEEQTNKRCAIVRSFDQELFDEALKVKGGPEFNTFISNSYVEKLPGKQEFELESSWRSGFIEDWKKDEKAFRTFSEKLVAFYKDKNEIDTLYHLTIADPDAAFKQIEEYVNEAARQFDLNRLYEMLQLLEERKGQISRDLNLLRKKLHAIYETRALWSNAYHETRIYQERDQTESLLEELRKGDGFSVLQLYAPGGMGKTMYLRNIIARHCVENRWPVAKVDFDYVPHLDVILDQPWRLLLSMAQQLNSQIPGRPFKSLLDSNQAYIARTNPASVRFEHSLEKFSEFDSTSKQEQIVDSFCSSIPNNNTFLLIFDTLEQLRHRQIGLQKLFELLTQLYERSTTTRVILAGRFNLAKPVSEGGKSIPFVEFLNGKLAKATGSSKSAGIHSKTEFLEPFTKKQAKSYLYKRNDLFQGHVKKNYWNTKDAGLINAVVKKSEGNPFKLALLAEIVERDEDISATEIEAYLDADFAYLIERIVRRIDEPWVRWILRYGVVPRKLTSNFVEKVILPAVQNIKNGIREHDDESKDKSFEKMDKDNPFSIHKLSEKPPAGLWEKLHEYASSYSWVKPVHESGALAFHSDVIRPIRELLLAHLNEGRKIYLTLQEAAFDYYDGLVLKNQQPQDLREAVYHKYLADEGIYSTQANVQKNNAGNEYWLESFDRYRHRERMLIELAREAIDIDAMLLKKEIDSPVSDEVLAWAVHTMAYSQLPENRRLNSEQHAAVNRWFIKAGEVDAERYVGKARLAVLEGCLLLASQKLADLKKVLESAQPEDDRTFIDLAILHVHYLDDTGSDGVERIINDVEFRLGALINASNERDREFGVFARQFLEEHKALEAYEGGYSLLAASYYEQLTERVEDFAVEDICRFAVRGIRFYEESAQEPRAVKLGQNVVKKIGSWQIDTEEREIAIAQIQAEIELVRREPQRALSFIRYISSLKSVPTSDPSWYDLQARVMASLLHISDAVKAWETAASLAVDDTSEVRFRAYTGCSQLYLDEVGDVEKAERYLKQVKVENHHANLTAWSVLRANLLRRKGEYRHARELLSKVLEHKREELRIEALVGLLSLEDGSDPGKITDVCAELADTLARVNSEQRLSLLERMKECLTFSLIHDTRADELLPLLSPTLLLDQVDAKRSLNTLRLVEVYRVLIDVHEARSLLDKFVDDRPQILCQVYRAYDRLEWEPVQLLQASKAVCRALGENQHQEIVLLLALDHIIRLKEHDEFSQLQQVAAMFKVSGNELEDLISGIFSVMGDRLGSVWMQRIEDLIFVDPNYIRIINYLERGIASNKEFKRGESFQQQLYVRLAQVSRREGDSERAYTYYNAALSIGEFEDQHLEMNVLSDLGYIYLDREEHELATELLGRALSISRDLGALRAEAIMLYRLAIVCSNVRDLSGSRLFAEESLELSIRLNDKHLQSLNLLLLGIVYDLDGNDEEARSVLQKGLDIRNEIGEGNSDVIEQIRSLLAKIERKGGLDRHEGLSKSKSERDEKASVKISVNLYGHNRVMTINDQQIEDDINLDFELANRQWLVNTSRSWSVGQFIRDISADLTGVSNQLGRFLIGDRLPVQENNLYVHVEISKAYSHLPWEFASINGEPLTFDDKIRRFYRRYPAKRPFTPSKSNVDVLIVRLGEELESLGSRGFSEIGGDLHYLFKKNGFSVEVLESPDVELLQNRLRKFQPSILYLEVNLIETGRGPSLYFDSSGIRSKGQKDFSSSDLAGILGDIHGEPLVILDTPGSPSMEDNMRQLILRNFFATDMIENHSHISTIITTGLADPYSFETAPIELLVPRLKEGGLLVEMMNSIWSYPSVEASQKNSKKHPHETLITYAGSTLFTRHPERILNIIR